MGIATIDISIEDKDNADLFLYKFSAWLSENISEYTFNIEDRFSEGELDRKYSVVIEEV